jgi:hypothetical protein
VEALPGLEAALRELYQRTLQGIGEGRTLVEFLHQNVLPASLRDHPGAVLPYLVMRDNFIKRVYHQRTGYWKPDGEGLEVVAPTEWAAALNLLAGKRESAFVGSIQTLLGQRDYILALKLADVSLLSYPKSDGLAALRRQALDGWTGSARSTSNSIHSSSSSTPSGLALLSRRLSESERKLDCYPYLLSGSRGSTVSGRQW